MRRLASALPVLALVLLCATNGFAADAEAGAKHTLSLLDLIIAGGVVMFLLLCLSLTCFSLALNWTFTIKRDTLIPPGMADDIHAALAEGVNDQSFENARNVVAEDNSMLGNILAAAFDKKDFGYTAMKESAEAVGIGEHNKYTSKVAWLSMFASSATLLGLLGTVSGIIGSFLKMASNPGGVDPNKLAENIGEALTCTAAGLSIAILGLYFFFFLRARVNQAAIDAAIIAQEILDYFRPAQGEAH